MFMGAVSACLIALGLIATASRLGLVFYVFGLLLLPTLSFIGLTTFSRALQTGLEDLEYARRISRLRACYFEHAPEVTPYLASVPQAQRLAVQGLHGGPWQRFRTVAGMVAVVTAVLLGASAGIAIGLGFGGATMPGVVGGAAVTAIATALLMRTERIAWKRASAATLFEQ